MNRTNRAIVLALLTTVATAVGQQTVVGRQTAVGKGYVLSIVPRTPERAISRAGLASEGTTKTTFGDRLINPVLGRPPEPLEDESLPRLVTATSASFDLEPAAAAVGQETVVGEEHVTSNAPRTPENAISRAGLASEGTARTMVGERLISEVLGRPAELPEDESPSKLVAATSASFDIGAEMDTPLAANQSSTCSGYSECGACGFGGSWIVEAEGVALAPRQRQNFGTCEFIDTDGSVIESHSTQNDASFTPSPRLTLGWQGECWGVQARYWRLQTGDLRPDFIVDHPFSGATPGDGFAIENSFRAETIDIEGKRLFCVGQKGAELSLSLGFRYAQLAEAAGLYVTSTNSALGTYRGDVTATHRFSGGGLTVGLRGIRPISSSNFNLFFGGRVSVLWDPNSSNFVATNADFLTSNAYARTFNGGAADSRSYLFIGEIQAGVQWNVPLKCIPANAFARLAFEYQHWSTASDGGVAAFSSAGPLGGPVVVASGRSIGNSGIDMLGFSLGTGLTW